jgi:hypothetical protein
VREVLEAQAAKDLDPVGDPLDVERDARRGIALELEAAGRLRRPWAVAAREKCGGEERGGEGRR